MGTASIKHPLPDRVKPPLTSGHSDATLGPEHQSARMSKLTKISYHYHQHLGYDKKRQGNMCFCYESRDSLWGTTMTATSTTAISDNGSKRSPWRPHGGQGHLFLYQSNNRFLTHDFICAVNSNFSLGRTVYSTIANR